MIPVDEIIAAQIASRFCRRHYNHSNKISSIMKECCNNLNISVPKLICCETMAKNFNAFYLRNEAYLIYDSCLIESLFLYNNILDTGVQNNDLDKFFYKFLGEELLKHNEYLPCLYLANQYTQLEYSFDSKIIPDHINRQISYQSYFLIAHELTHLSLSPKGYLGIPDDYKHFLNISFRILSERARDNRSERDFLQERFGYFLDICPMTLEEYYKILPNSSRYQHFVEECYCDFRGMQLLLENYSEPEEGIRAISSALNYLITQEYMRCDFKNGTTQFSNAGEEASLSMYLSVFRMEMLLITIQFNQLTIIDKAFQEIQNRLPLTEYWKQFVKKLPDLSELPFLSDINTPNLEKTELINLVLNSFYYCHFD